MHKVVRAAFGLVSVATMVPGSAVAACYIHGQYAYGSLYYKGNPFTSVSGDVTTSDHLIVVIYVNKCLKRNHTYSIKNKVAFSSAGADATDENGVPFWTINRGDANSSVKGSFTTDGASNPVSWSFTFDLGSSLSMVSQSGSNAVDSAGGQQGNVSGYGFNNGPVGVWLTF